MKKYTASFAGWIAQRLYNIGSWLEKKYSSTDLQEKFVDLAPTDKADKDGIYSDALIFAIKNPNVFNIALTGPYGSGKSSIIQAFLKTYRRRPLHISLATFVPENNSEEENVSRQEIERSILQQMLYGADANKLPLSRFKRIQSPGVGALLKSLYITLGVISIWYIMERREDIINGSYFTPPVLDNIVDLGFFSFAVIFLWALLHYFYIKSFGLSLKGISLKNVEIKPACDDETSILNRHLDEIIYFFQSTNYELVIIEDLDRFNNSDIFVTLREINCLVNANAGVKRHIRFLYALRDDMFINTERTKFFEFIIPVIPIINTSNSIDMVLEQEKRLAVGEGLDRQFLREVSRYLNDLRLIQNIFNEYAIYVANLETDGENILDGNKLLAVLIYKNVYPRDFEQLHRGEGALAKILDHQAELINKSEDECRAEIVQLEKLIEVGEDQTPLDLDELRKIYAMALIEKLPSGAFSIGHNSNNMIEFQKLATHSDLFEEYLESSNICCRYNNNYNTHVNIKNWHTSVNSQKTYYQRKEEIKNKAEERKVEILGKIRDLRLKLPVFRTTKLSELLRLNSSDAQVLFEGFGENGELARFLILESFLDDTYYQYTSLFHSGRMSPNDNKYLIQIRAFITPEPDFPIDNPHEVIAAMREEDFGQSYVLNMVIVDALLSDKNRYKEQVQKLYSYIKIEFESCEHFLDGYYTSGHNVVDFLFGLNDVWDRLVPSILTSNYNIRHITQLVKWLPLNSLKSLAENFDDMSNFVSEHLLDILCEVPELDPNRLVCLNFEVKDLLSIKEHSQVVCTMFEEGLFALSIGNLEFIYKELLAKDDVNMLNTKNYTTILSTKNSILIGRVERDFEYYLRNILLVLDNNSEEDLSAILVAICHDEIELSVLSEFLKQQVVQLPTLEKVPDRLYTMIFDTAKIKPTWANCLTFMDSDSFRNETLVKYLDKQSVCDSILEEEIPSNSDSFNLHTLLINANSMSDYSYKGYVCALPNVFKSFPSGLDLTKIKILIEKKKINFTKNNFNFLENTQTLQVLFVSLNIDMFLDNSECFDLSDDFLEHLLQTEISEINKFNVIKFMNLAILVDHHERAALIGSIVVNDDTNYCNVDGYIAKSIIMYSSPTTLQILLFNKYCTLMTNSDVREVLSNLPKPYCEITTGYHTPRLKNSLENKNLVMQLDHQNIISSWTIGGIFTDEIKVNLYRKKEETV